MPKPLIDLIPAGMRLRAHRQRSKPLYVQADGHAVADAVTIEKDGKTYTVRIKEEPRHGKTEETVSVAVIHRIS